MTRWPAAALAALVLLSPAHAGTGDPSGGDVRAVQVVLGWRDPAAVATLVRDISTPSSPAYRRHLSPAEFRDRFAPTPEVVLLAQSWLAAAGLELGRVPANRLYVPARGTRSQLSRLGTLPAALTTLGAMLLDEDRAAPVVPSAEALGEPPVPVPDMPATPADTPPPPAVVYGAPCSAYHGARVEPSLPPVYGRRQPAVHCGTSIAAQRAAYGADRLLRRGVDGAGQTIVITGSHSIQPLPADVATWSKRYGLPPMRPGQLTQLSHPGAYQTPNVEPYLRPQVWSLQAHMLVENIHAMAPGAAVVYLGSTTSLDIQNATVAAVDLKLGNIVVNGWYTVGESTNPAQVALISRTAEQAAATGITLLFGSGSIGDTTAFGGSEGPVYPANDPLVTAVGATSLILGRRGYEREVGWAKSVHTLEGRTWEEADPGTFRGSGGGVSAVHPQPEYQAGVVPAALADRGDGSRGRAVPDIAVNGDAETGLVIGLTQRFPDGSDRYAERRHASGESATAVFAALVALANDAAGHDHGFLNPALYALARARRPAFRDVVAWGGVHAGIRTDYADGANRGSGLIRVLKTFEAFGANVTRRGYDTNTGLGAPSPAFLELLR